MSLVVYMLKGSAFGVATS